MNPVTHFLAGWAAGLPFDLSRRERALVAAASVSPDIDGLPVLLDLAGRHSPWNMEYWSSFHHSLHNIVFAIVVSLVCMALAKRRYVMAGLAFLVANLHYLCDIVGSRGPDGYHWPVPYLMPFSDWWQLSVPWQWELNAWPNVLITAVLMCVAIYYAWRRGYSPVGLFSTRADNAFTEILAARFGKIK